MNDSKLSFKERFDLIMDAPIDTAIYSGHEKGWSFEKELEAKEYLEGAVSLCGWTMLAGLAFATFKLVRLTRKLRRRKNV